MWWLAEGVDEGRGAGKRKSTGAEGFLPTQLTCLLWLQGAESDIIMNSLIICSITGLQAVKRHTPRLTTSAPAVNDPKAMPLTQLETGKSGGMFSRH